MTDTTNPSQISFHIGLAAVLIALFACVTHCTLESTRIERSAKCTEPPG